MIEALRVLQKQRNEMQRQINTIDAAIRILGGRNHTGPKKRVVSAAAKRKMSLAAKKRWAARKKATS
jgi:hypothetical protein